MAYRPGTAPEAGLSEGALLHRLLGLYAEERKLYQRVLELSQRQGELMRAGRSLAEVQRILEQKKNCLAIVTRLESTERENKREWERRRAGFSADGRRRLRASLDQVAGLIEKILLCEEENDKHLIAQAQAV